MIPHYENDDGTVLPNVMESDSDDNQSVSFDFIYGMNEKGCTKK